MPFDQSTITSIDPPATRAGQLRVHWTSTSPADQWWQVYVSRQLTWWGQGTDAEFPAPSSSRVRIDIGAVDPDEIMTDFSASLPRVLNDKVRLTWVGGTFEGDDIQGYHVYWEETPGSGIDYAKPVATVTAYPAGIIADGFGLGGFGEGGFGRTASTYEWTSRALTSGTRWFAVKPFDRAGNEGPGRTCSVTITVPPQPPARNAGGKRLTYAYDPATKRITLNWLPSPG